MKADVAEIQQFVSSGKQITKAVREQTRQLDSTCKQANSLGDTRIEEINTAACGALSKIRIYMDALDELWPVLEREALDIIQANSKPIGAPIQGGRHR